MRPFFFFSFFSAVALVTADHTELIDNQDKRITFSNGWEIKNSAGDGNTLSFNDKDSGTASLRVYNASKIAVCVFVEGLGQVVRISLDKKDYDTRPLPYPQPAWTSDTLNPNGPHDLVITKRNPKGQYIALDYILVTYYDPPIATSYQYTATAAPMSNAPNQLMPSAAIATPPSTQTKITGGALSSDRLPSDSSPGINTSTGASGETNVGTNPGGFDVSSRTTQSAVQSDPSIPPLFTSPLVPQASPTTSEQQLNTEPVLSGGKLAAVILACIAAPILVFVGIILYRRRMIVKRKAASTAYLEWIAAHGDVPPGPVFSPPPPHEKVGGTEDLVGLGSPTSDSGDSHTVAVTL